MEKLTNEEIQAKADSLSEKFKNKVTPIVITANDGEQIVGYFQEPEYDVMMYVTDAYLAKEMSKAAEATLRSCLVSEESNPRINSDKRSDAKIKASFASACLQFVTPYADEYKKK